jgi:hypothetical protein
VKRGRPLLSYLLSGNMESSELPVDMAGKLRPNCVRYAGTGRRLAGCIKNVVTSALRILHLCIRVYLATLSAFQAV